MLEVAYLTVKNVGMLLVYIAAGYLLCQSHKLPENEPAALSKLCTMLLSPAYIIYNLSTNFTANRIGENALMLGYGILFTVVVVIFGIVLAKFFAKNPFERKSLTYAFTFPNYGYFGYPVIEGVFGSAVLAEVLIFCLPINIACNTYGYLLFSPEKKVSWKQILLIPTVIASLIGMSIGLSGIVLPDFCNNILANIGNCMSPISMILGGFVLGHFPLKKLLSNVRAYWLSAIRMLLIPIIVVGAFMLVGVRGMYLMAPGLFVSLPLGLNLVVFPESYGLDASDNARLCFISYLLAIVVLPISFGLLSYLAGM